MLEIQGVLEAIKEDELADFNPEYFKRLEKENRDFRRRKSKSLKSVYTGTLVLVVRMVVV